MEHWQFVELVIEIARRLGFKIETNRDGVLQIDFGYKKLHAGHLRKLFPRILQKDVNVAKLVEEVAPGRPCTHKPMREIVAQIVNLQSPVVEQKCCDVSAA
jgi:hypothetical protein